MALESQCQMTLRKIQDNSKITFAQSLEYCLMFHNIIQEKKQKRKNNVVKQIQFIIVAHSFQQILV